MNVSIRHIIHVFCPQRLKPYWSRIESSDIGSRLAGGAFWVLAGSIISRGLMLCATILVARFLGKTVYGELGMIQSTIGMFGVFAGFGLGLTATKHVAEFRTTAPERAGRIIAISGLFAMFSGGVIATSLLIFAPWLAEHTINAPHLTNVLRIGAIILFINALNGAQTGALSGFEAFKTIAGVNLFVGLLSFPILVTGAYFGNLTGAAWALVINLSINWLLNHLALRKEAHQQNIPFTFQNCTKEWHILWKFSLPAALSGFVVGPVNWACGALLVNQPNGYAEMGIFNAANQWRLAILFIPQMLGQVLLPLLSNLHGKSEDKHYKKVLRLNLFLNTSLAVLVVIPLSLLANFIMKTYGSGFDEGSNVLRILAFSAVLVAANSVVGHAIVSKGKMWFGCIFNCLWAIALLTVASILLQKGYGALGLAYATLIAYLFHTLWQSIYLATILK